eukprot:5381094-Amphidinium_carterae.1
MTFKPGFCATEPPRNSRQGDHPAREVPRGGRRNLLFEPQLSCKSVANQGCSDHGAQYNYRQNQIKWKVAEHFGPDQ